jgi:hypothetical protein
MLAAGAIVGISVGLAFLAGLVGLIIHNRYSWRRYRAKQESSKKGKDPERAEGAEGANGGAVFSMTGARAGERDQEFRRRELQGMGIDPAQQPQDVEMEPVAPPHGEYGYSLDAMVEGHNHPHGVSGGAEGQGQVVYSHSRENSNGGVMPGVPGVEQHDDEIRPAPRSSYSPTSFAQRQAVSQSPVTQSPVTRSPVPRSPESRSPVAESHASGSPIARRPGYHSPVAGSPVARSPASLVQQPQYAPPPDDPQDVGRAI